MLDWIFSGDRFYIMHGLLRLTLTICSRYLYSFFVVLAIIYVDFCITPFYAALSEGVFDLGRVLHVEPGLDSRLQKNKIWAKEVAFLRPSEWVFAHLQWVFFASDYPDVVIAHYREDLHWLAKYHPFLGHIYLYCKDKNYCTLGLPSDIEPSKLTITYLPNVGRESHTYLYHILHNYGSFSKRTVFTMASLNNNYLRYYSFLTSLMDKKPSYRALLPGSTDRLADFSMSALTQGVSLGDGYDYRQGGLIIQAYPRPLGAWAKKHMHFDVARYNGRYGRSKHGAIFTVSSEALLRHNFSDYEHLFFLSAISDAIESGYYMERLWRFYFQV